MSFQRSVELVICIIVLPIVYGAFSEEHSKTMPKENVFEFASSRNMLDLDPDEKRGFWDKRGYGDKRQSICEVYPSLCIIGLIGRNELMRETRGRGLFFDRRGYGDRSKRGFWDKRGYGDRREILKDFNSRFGNLLEPQA